MRKERRRRNGAGDGDAGLVVAERVRRGAGSDCGGGGGAEKMTVTAEVVLGLFWSDFWNIKYMDKIHRRMYRRWKMINFLLFNK